MGIDIILICINAKERENDVKTKLKQAKEQAKTFLSEEGQTF